MSKKIKYVGIGLIAILLIASAFVFIDQVKATTIDFFVDNMNNATGSTIAAPQTSGHTFIFAPVHNITNADTIVITFAAHTGAIAGFQGLGSLAISDLTLTDGVTPVLLGLCASSTSNWVPTFSQVAGTITLTGCSAAPTINSGDTVQLVVADGKIENPDGVNTPYTINLTGIATDSGSTTVDIAAPGDVGVTGTVTQTISFLLSTQNVAFGTLSLSSAKTTTHTMTISTNAASGMAIVVTGATLHAGAHNIAVCYGGTPGNNGANVRCVSHPGVEQFGINLRANSTPPMGTPNNSADPSGSAPIGIVNTDYNTTNQFTFHSGDTVANSNPTPGPINATVYTVSYLANIAGTTPAGAYTTTLTYTATCTY